MSERTNKTKKTEPKATRLNAHYHRKEELVAAVDELKERGFQVNLSFVIEALLDDYLDHRHKKALKGKTTHEYLRILIDGS